MPDHHLQSHGLLNGAALAVERELQLESARGEEAGVARGGELELTDGQLEEQVLDAALAEVIGELGHHTLGGEARREGGGRVIGGSAQCEERQQQPQ